MEDFTVFISSSDSYSDLWDLFFDLFKTNWPEYNGQIVLNTECLSYERDDLNIKCTKVGNLGSFGKVFRKGLEQVETENVLLIMIDYIFMDKVDNNKVEEYYGFFRKNNLDSLCLVYQGQPNIEKTDNLDIMFSYPKPPHKLFSFQIAFWKKALLYKMVLPHESPWLSEWFGSLRADKINVKWGCLAPTSKRPISYDLKGCLHQGKWLKEAVNYLNSIKYDINYEKRGFYQNEYGALKFRIKFKIKLLIGGVLGVYWDLFKR